MSAAVLAMAAGAACGAAVPPAAPASAGPTQRAAPPTVLSADTSYVPLNDVGEHLKIGLDVRDLEVLWRGADAGRVDWNAVSAIYEAGRHSRAGTGAGAGTGSGTGGGGSGGGGGAGGSGGAPGVRSLRGVATTATVLDRFPNAQQVYGSASFLGAHMRAATQGTGRASGWADPPRVELARGAVMTMVYATVLQELDTARIKVTQRQTAAAQAAHNVDEAWAFYIGAADAQGDHPYLLSALARRREADFHVKGQLDRPLQQGLGAMQLAARAGDLTTFDAAFADVEGQLNAIFYLEVLRCADLAARSEGDATNVALASLWAGWQPLRAFVARESLTEARAIDAVTEGAARLTVDDLGRLKTALHSEAALRALRIPTALLQR